MIRRTLFFATLLLCLFSFANAQKITYSDPDKDDPRQVNFDIIGRLNDHFLVYKNTRNAFNITVYDSEMKQVGKQDLAFLPQRTLGVDFLAYKDFVYVFFQFQRKNSVYAAYVKLNAEAKLMMDPVILDTTEVNYSSSSKIYTFINSDDKKKIAVFKINSKNDRSYVVTTVLFDHDMTRVNKRQVKVAMDNKNDFLNEFTVDNDGDLVFLRSSGSSQKNNITKLTLFYAGVTEDSVTAYDLTLSKIYLDDIRVKADNINKNFLITSFFSSGKKGNVDGLYATLWSKTSKTERATTNTTFNEDLRNEAKTEGSLKAAFNNYYLQNIVMKKNGGFFVASESVYTSSRGGMYNRWDYMYGSPFMSPIDYYYYSPYYSGYYPWGRWGGFNNITRYYADNIAILSFDSTANLDWGNVITKSQFDDNTDNFIGYTTFNTGSEVHFIYNLSEKRTLLLNDQSIDIKGQITRNPTFRNLDKGYEFMPRYAKQVGSHTMIVPCQYRNYICFAKIEF
ncbi:hypothetical protein QTN47_04170 [Danxiaibacter flavus]|uniref:Uncharacterized protein n=1 Tax=Danxiaibacter flavus TaxID=3049108 RepID=A0ABV3ZE42_9BACT|nr:hypothetical protein QNM32_04170 [Chitinophagaceae bacterium DXS]